MFCGNCFSGEYSYLEVSSAETLYSYTISRQTAEAARRDELPYLTVVVELDDGPRMVGAAAIADPGTVRLGERIHIIPQRRTDDSAYLTVIFDEKESH